MKSGSFARITTVTATTQRMGAVANGLSGDMANSVVDFKCTPLYPLTSEVAKMVGLANFAELLITYCENQDILEGDTLITGGVTYKIRAVAQWFWQPTDANRLAIVLEEDKS